MKDKNGTEIKVGDKLRHRASKHQYAVEAVAEAWAVVVRPVGDVMRELFEFPEYVEVVAPDVVLWCNVGPDVLSGYRSFVAAASANDGFEVVGRVEINVSQRTATWHEVGQ